tara:strand:+ start:421 stop:1191 length:771 start_codon:yes stop_codon:yes gene_type:complete
MNNFFKILGCGSSLGSPWINNTWGKCNKLNKKNKRTRCSAFLRIDDISVLIDASPDIKDQFLKNELKELDYVLFTHEHADQTSGIFELRPFYWINKRRIPIYGSVRTIRELKKSHEYCFSHKNGYKPILKANHTKSNFILKKGGHKINVKSFEVQHGQITSTAYIINKIAYLSDCNKISDKDLPLLKNLNCLIIDCLKKEKHPSHFNMDESIELSKYLKPKKTILTNLHTDLDYNNLKTFLPKNIIPAYDGITINL